MQGNMNPKIIGACLVGSALVAGAYVLSDFGVKNIPTQEASVISAEREPRVAIAVTDKDENGIEDWRDEFVTVDPIEIDEATAGVYTPPTTLTDQFGLNYMEGFLRTKVYGPFSQTQEEILDDSYEILKQEATDELFDTPDITVLRNWEGEDILTYANTIALAITNNNIAGAENEVVILDEILQNDSAERIDELQALANVYKNMRDDTIATPVPGFLQKEHLDLINTYHAIYKDIEAMTLSLDDPIVTLMRLKRYEDDATGLGLALENMYSALVPYAELVGPNDPALLFAIYSPEFNS